MDATIDWAHALNNLVHHTKKGRRAKENYVYMYGHACTVCMAMYLWLCMCGHVCMAVYVWLCMYGYVRMAMYGYVCMAIYVWQCKYG